MKKKKKVLFLTNVPSPYRVAFFNELGKLCDLTVLYELESAQDRDERWVLNEKEYYRKIILTNLFSFDSTAFCPSVKKYLKRASYYDIILVGGYSTPTGMYAIQYLYYHKIPFLLNFDGAIKKPEKLWKYKIKEYFISKAVGWLSTGEKCDQYLLHYGAKEKSIYHYPFTSLMEKDILSAPVIREEKLLRKQKLGFSEKVMILAVGQFIYRKGFDILIKSMQFLPKKYVVVIIGGEPTEEYLSLKNTFGLENLHFIDFCSKEELANYYKAADVFVLPTREDIWGLVINEAMAFGLPVVTTLNCVAGLELIRNEENGFLVPVGKAKVLAKRIQDCVEAEMEGNRMGKASLQKIKKYTIEEMAKRHREVFEEFE